MPSKYEVEATHVINLYLWDRLNENLEKYWQEIPGFGIPIIPVQQQPEVTESKQDYIVYSYADQSSKDLHLYQTQDITWILFSSSSASISATIALCRDIFGQWDESAAGVNDWLRNATLPQGYEHLYRRYNFKSIQLLGSTSGQPARDEGGTMDGLIDISCSFVEIDK